MIYPYYKCPFMKMKAVHTNSLNLEHYKHPIWKIDFVCLFHVDSGPKSLTSASKLQFRSVKFIKVDVV